MGWESAGNEIAAFGEAVGGEIGPVEDFAAAGQFGDGGGVLEKHVAPQHEGFAVAGGFLADEADVVDVLAGDVVGRGMGMAFAEVVGFVAAEVEASGGKAGEEFVENAAEEELRLGVAGVQRGAAQALEPGGGFPVCGGEFHFGQMPVGGEREDAAHVAEAGKGGDQFDEVGVAIRVEFAEVLCVVGVGVAGDGGIELEAEGVFEIELEVVDFEGGEQADAALEGVEARYPAAADVEIIAAQGQNGRVGYFEAGEAVGRLAEDLAQGLEGVEMAGGVGRAEVDAVGGDEEGIGFRRASRVLQFQIRGRLPVGDMMQSRKDIMQFAAQAGIHRLRGGDRWRAGQDK